MTAPLQVPTFRCHPWPTWCAFASLVLMLCLSPVVLVEGFPQRAIPAICGVLKTNNVAYVQRGSRCMPVDEEAFLQSLEWNPPMSIVRQRVDHNRGGSNYFDLGTY